MKNDALEALDQLLAAEEDFFRRPPSVEAARSLQGTRHEMQGHIRAIGRSGDLPLIVTAERMIVDGDLVRYANSVAMTNSLKAAIGELSVAERHIGIVDDPQKYRAVDQAHSLPRNRKGGLPLDEARQALASHYTRLNNLDKARLVDDEKKVIDARKTAVFEAVKLYTARQAKTLGVDLAQGKKRGNRL
ncbi:hypothetical protein [Verminephrobacter aporrectodeae]|uniref:hypothetical protein n=1 Tax=Verminephrobacter aporrectodeae TaxID=1110389 RepID=UPI00223858C1|nr:hypothetical protein [Verminephrobacter aporrectodeae]